MKYRFLLLGLFSLSVTGCSDLFGSGEEPELPSATMAVIAPVDPTPTTEGDTPEDDPVEPFESGDGGGVTLGGSAGARSVD